MECNGEVLPERTPIDALMAEEAATWMSIATSLYRLWLASGSYESFSEMALRDPDGEVNQRGIALAADITNRGLPTYLWWFVPDQDASVPACPRCCGLLSSWLPRDWRVCSSCRIVL